MAHASRPIDDSTDDAAPPRDADAVQTFVLEVSASEAAGVGEATGRPRGDARAESGVERELKAVARLIRDAIENPTRTIRDEDEAAPSVDVAAQPDDAVLVAPALPRTALTPTKARTSNLNKRRTWPACYLSAVVHVTFLASIAVMGVALPESLQELQLFVAPEMPDEAAFSEPEAVDDAPAGEGLEQLADELAGGPLDIGEEAFGGDAGELSFGELSPEALAAGEPGDPVDGFGDGSLKDVGLLFGAGSGDGHGGAGGGGVGDGLGARPLAKFFGTKIEGRRIVFVLDNSGSMQGGRLETVIDELKRCVDSLDRDQEFYVIFYSDAIYPLFYPEPANQYVPAHDRNKRLLADWLDTVELCVGDAVIEALAAAAMIEPDVVFLLSDGRVQGAKKMAFLLDARNRDFPIHTVGIGLGAGAASRRNLQEIALANGGDFREGEVPPAMKELARTNPRPYHSESPGLLWGRQVKARRSGR